MRLSIALIVLTTLVSPADAQPRRAERAARLIQTGRALVTGGNPISATSYFRRAIQVDRSAAGGYLGLAEIYVSQGRIETALEVLRAGIRRRPNSVDLHLLLARALKARGRLDEAAELLRDLVRREPSSIAAHAQRAELARERGAWSEALASSRAIVALGRVDEDVPQATVAEAAEFVRALRLLVGSVDPLSHCEGGPVRDALCHATGL